MNEFDPNRTVPVEKLAASREDEELLLLEPIVNASALFELYEARARIHLERAQSGVDGATEDLIESLERMKIASKLLPSEDPRSYDAWKNKFCTPRQQG